MTDLEQLSRDYARVERAIGFLEENFQRQPPLAEIAEAVGLSEFHFQRLFGRWVGISPKRFLQHVTKEYAKKLLADSGSLLEVAYDAGLSGPGRLHDLFVACEAVTPGEYKAAGAGLEVAYGFHPSPFGECLLAAGERGVVGLHFVREGGRELQVRNLGRAWPRARLEQRPELTGPLAARIFTFPPDRPSAPLHLYVRGTNFQIKVWEALLGIPLGRVVTYSELARHLGMPKAARAVGNAVGSNPIPFLIPCHRVIRKLGEFGHYGGGRLRKRAMLGWEATLCTRQAPAQVRTSLRVERLEPGGANGGDGSGS